MIHEFNTVHTIIPNLNTHYFFGMEVVLLMVLPIFYPDYHRAKKNDDSLEIFWKHTDHQYQ